jgi:beclin 1
MIAATLPSSSAPYSHGSGDSQRHDSISSKSTWQRTKSSALVNTGAPPLSPRAQGKQPQRNSPLPNESFVVLQDSVIHAIQPPPASPIKVKGNVPKARSDTTLAHTPPTAKPVEPEPDSPSPLSHHLRSTARLFNLLSTRTEIDHPLCAECTQILLTNLRKQLEETKKERDGYIAFSNAM